MTIRFYLGKLGREHLIYTKEDAKIIPKHKDLVVIKEEVYEVINIMFYDDPKDDMAFSVFLRRYNWEE